MTDCWRSGWVGENGGRSVMDTNLLTLVGSPSAGALARRITRRAATPTRALSPRQRRSKGGVGAPHRRRRSAPPLRLLTGGPLAALTRTLDRQTRSRSHSCPGTRLPAEDRPFESWRQLHTRSRPKLIHFGRGLVLQAHIIVLKEARQAILARPPSGESNPA